MDKNFLLKITNELYRLTLLFPKKEPLRYKMRELADNILANPSQKELEVLDSFFEVAKSQNWIKTQEILNLQAEYSKLKEGLETQKAEKELKITQVGPVQIPVGNRISINERQEKILEFLRENGQAQVWQVKQILPEVTKRTLRRDFEHLLSQGVIERIGERNETFYTLARQSRAKGGEEDLSSSTQLKEVRTQLGHTYI